MELNLASWNVNGIRAASGKDGFRDYFAAAPFDIIGLQETKAAPEQVPPELKKLQGFNSYFCSSTVKKGYSGTAVYSRLAPLAVTYELPDPRYGGEGRLITLEYDRFYLLNGYFPNGGAPVLDERGRETGAFVRVPYKMGYFDCLLKYTQDLRQKKPVVICGDFNIAHKAVDLANPKSNETNTGFLPEERAFLDTFVQAGFIDTFRFVHGDLTGCYSWWSYKTRARERNVGWRIDYFFVSEELKDHIADARIEDQVTGSDHCPVTLKLRF